MTGKGLKELDLENNKNSPFLIILSLTIPSFKDTPKIAKHPPVVYFDEQMGASHAVGWAKLYQRRKMHIKRGPVISC